MTTETTPKIHPFEQAELGIAPFKFLGAFEDRGPHTWTNADGTTTSAGAPGQPMGCCAYCGQGIAICCTIQDAQGKTFTVGSDCVRKTYAAGTVVRTQVERAIATAKKAKEEAKWQAARDRLATDEGLRAAMAAKPSPNRNRPQDSALAWADWMMANAGTQGRLDVTRYIARLGV